MTSLLLLGGSLVSRVIASIFVSKNLLLALRSSNIVEFISFHTECVSGGDDVDDGGKTNAFRAIRTVPDEDTCQVSDAHGILSI